MRQNWDATTSVLVAAVFAVATLGTGRTVDNITPYLAAGIAGGLAAAFATAVLSRWLYDHLKDDYGSLIRSTVDKHLKTAMRPYLVVIYASVGAAIYAIALAFISTIISGTWALVILTSGYIAIGLYVLLGFISLISITKRHMARSARILYLKEEEARRQRREKS
ncbi:hypothetical protein RN2511_014800 [Rhodococcus sp. NKCM2511]|nr:hypothetical protein RN2511_014800 [Rhodococcus sp. NKCM2511]